LPEAVLPAPMAIRSFTVPSAVLPRARALLPMAMALRPAAAAYAPCAIAGP
jgi:hypothetical protein